LVEQPGSITDRQFEIEFLDSGVEARRRHDIRESNLRRILPLIGHLPLQILETSTPCDLVKDAYPITAPDAYAVGTRHKLLWRVGHTTIAIQKRYLTWPPRSVLAR